MMATIRTTTGRENIVIDSITTRVKSHGLPVKALLHPTDLKGYIFIEGEPGDIEAAVKGIQHVRGLINKDVPIDQVEKFFVTEKMTIKIELGDVVEIVGGPFKGEKGKVTRIDDTKNEVTVEFLEAAIPIPVTISQNSVRMHDKAK